MDCSTPGTNLILKHHIFGVGSELLRDPRWHLIAEFSACYCRSSCYPPKTTSILLLLFFSVENLSLKTSLMLCFILESLFGHPSQTRALPEFLQSITPSIIYSFGI